MTTRNGGVGQQELIGNIRKVRTAPLMEKKIILLCTSPMKMQKHMHVGPESVYQLKQNLNLLLVEVWIKKFMLGAMILLRRASSWPIIFKERSPIKIPKRMDLKERLR